ncbi:MAG TPA: hypothetical protein VK991_09880, partial [Halomonas sp.]|nr:hypothetical protein [Halomonas sp.]
MKITSANPTVSESMPITQKGASAESKALLKASNIEKALAILGCLKEQALKRYVWLYNHHIPQK